MATHYQGNPEEVRALNTYIKLVRGTETITERIHRSLSEIGLTMSQLGVLEVLFHLGSLPQKTIAQKLLKTNGNITMVVDNLEKRDLVKRERRQHDRRVIEVHLSEKGRELISQIFPSHVAKIVHELNVLTPEEQEELGRLCRKIGLGDKTKP